MPFYTVNLKQIKGGGEQLISVISPSNMYGLFDLVYSALNFRFASVTGDIIFAVDGQSTENETHDDLVEKIQACKTNMRWVVA